MGGHLKLTHNDIIITVDFSYTRYPERDREIERDREVLCGDVRWLHHVPPLHHDNRINTPSGMAYN
jgi:hypothetical protein